MPTSHGNENGPTFPKPAEGDTEMHSIESEGKTVEEAVESALEQLEVSREQVDVEVIEEPHGGLFGLGSSPACVRVTVKAGDDGPHAVLTTLLDLMGIEGTVTERSGDSEIYLKIESPDAALLIGRGGRCLNSLQFLVNRMLNRQGKLDKRVIVDVAGYRERRQQSLTAMAERLAEKAKRTGREVRLHPLDPQDRRAVHLALKDDPAVDTHSVGDGIYRTVVINPEGSNRRREPRSRDHR